MHPRVTPTLFKIPVILLLSFRDKYLQAIDDMGLSIPSVRI